MTETTKDLMTLWACVAAGWLVLAYVIARIFGEVAHGTRATRDSEK